MDVRLTENRINPVEIGIIKSGDYAMLLAEYNGKQEAFWVKTVKSEKGYSGVILEDPVIATPLKKGQEIEFEIINVFSLSTADQTQAIINKYRSQGEIPGYKISGIKSISQHVNEWIELENPWLKINNKDKKAFLKDIKDLSLDANGPEALESVYRIFLSLIFMVVTPQIVRNALEGKVLDKKLKQKLDKMLSESYQVYKQISSSHYYLLEQMRTFHSGSTIEDLPSEELGRYFADMIDTARAALI